jgi:hypothetical protein
MSSGTGLWQTTPNQSFTFGALSFLRFDCRFKYHNYALQTLIRQNCINFYKGSFWARLEYIPLYTVNRGPCSRLAHTTPVTLYEAWVPSIAPNEILTSPLSVGLWSF